MVDPGWFTLLKDRDELSAPRQGGVSRDPDAFRVQQLLGEARQTRALLLEI